MNWCILWKFLSLYAEQLWWLEYFDISWNNKSANKAGFPKPSYKSVMQYENTTGATCHVKILDKYLQKIPRSADTFNLTLVAVLPSDSASLGLQKYQWEKIHLIRCWKRCAKKQVSLRHIYTNHSLRAYGATTLFHGEFPEKIIQQCTGYKSLNRLWQYERTPETQLLDIFNVLSNNSKLKTGVVPDTY